VGCTGGLYWWTVLVGCLVQKTLRILGSSTVPRDFSLFSLVGLGRSELGVRNQKRNEACPEYETTFFVSYATLIQSMSTVQLLDGATKRISKIN
jgi:hypothetical protein